MVAAPDARLGEHACAIVRLAPGAAPIELVDITAQLERVGLARQKWPEELRVVTDFPRTASGKVRKVDLRRELRAEASDGRLDGVRSGAYRTIEVAPIAGALGAEISGVDLAADLTDETVAEIRARLARAPRRLLPRPGARPGRVPRLRAPASASRSSTRSCRGIDGFPEIIAVAKLPHETVNFGGIWHSDTVYLERAADGHDARRARGPAIRRRHDVREHVRRVRRALARAATRCSTGSAP